MTTRIRLDDGSEILVHRAEYDEPSNDGTHTLTRLGPPRITHNGNPITETEARDLIARRLIGSRTATAVSTDAGTITPPPAATRTAAATTVYHLPDDYMLTVHHPTYSTEHRLVAEQQDWHTLTKPDGLLTIPIAPHIAHRLLDGITWIETTTYADTAARRTVYTHGTPNP